MTKRTNTTKDVATLKQLHDGGQLILATEFQRNAVWPKAAKAYLIDTLLADRPVPYMYFRRSVSAQTGRSQYEVIDGQQRLRAIFEFLEGSISLTESKDRTFRGKTVAQLTDRQRAKVLSYDLYIEELTGYSDTDIKDIFIRMNRFVVKLSPQEIRHAEFSGRFADLTETLGKWPFWKTQRVFTPLQVSRMRAVELAAELVILLVEGPQDKKAAVDLYYARYETRLPFRKEVVHRLNRYLKWLSDTVPNCRRTRYRKPTDLYALIGALEKLSDYGRRLGSLKSPAIGRALARFGTQTRNKNPIGKPARYLAAASRQTDNLTPRLTRIEILTDVMRDA